MSEQQAVLFTSPAIDRANRLLSLKANPGFIDLLQISQQLVQEAIDATSDYPGWDAQQIVVLKVRQQAAKEHHQALIQRVLAAIQTGIDEARANASNLPVKTAGEALDQGDYVRQEVLKKFDDEDNRVSGSY
jgi:hypothetical protein